MSLGGEAGAELGVGGDTAGDEDGAGAEAPGGGEGLLEEVSDDGVLEAGEEVEGLGLERAVGDQSDDSFGGGFEVVEDGAAGFDDRRHGVGLGVAEDGGLNAAEGEVEARVGGGFGMASFDGGEGKGNGSGVTVGSEAIDPGASGVAETEEFGDLVEGFAGGVVDGAADVAVGPGEWMWDVDVASLPCLPGVGEVEVSVAAGDDEGEGGGLLGAC